MLFSSKNCQARRAVLHTSGSRIADVFQLDGSLVGVYDVTKTTGSFRARTSSPLQTLPLVLLAYHLAVRAPAEGPPEGRPAAPNGREQQSEAFCSEEGAELYCCSLVISAHLRVDNSFHGRRSFCCATTPLGPCKRACLAISHQHPRDSCCVALNPSSSRASTMAGGESMCSAWARARRYGIVRSS